MKIAINNKQTYGARPLIKKGYYPAKLVKIEERKKKDSEEPYVSTFNNSKARQLILTFLIYKSNPDTEEPTVPVKFTDPVTNIEQDVRLAKFLNWFYMNENETEWRSNLTPKSVLTQTLTSAWIVTGKQDQ